MITRRSLLLTGAIGLLVAQRQSHGQPKPKIARIGILWFGSRDTPTTVHNLAVFRERLAALGYVEGKNIVIEERAADGKVDRLRETRASLRRETLMSSSRLRSRPPARRDRRPARFRS